MGGAFEHRGFMLDVSRHYMPVEEIRRLLEGAALCGMNRMHWHLTDDQGWRIEIRKYPRLTETGSRRGESFFGVDRTENNCGFYTQEEIREIVAFAKGKGIEIIPEIEIPGHAGAMLAAYPEFGCRRGGKAPEESWPYRVRVSGGIFPDLVCAGRPEAVQFLKDILDEVTELFPFPMVHIGGDEALKIHWRRCPDCRRRMREEGLADEDALQRSLVLEIGEYLKSKGRETIVWNDVLEGGNLPGYFIVQQWMSGEGKARAFLESGGRVIISDTDGYYLDYPYGRIDLRKIREYPRIPGYAKGMEDRVLGLECPLWTERITNAERAAFMLFPRMAAVGLKAGREEEESWESFRERIRETVFRLEKAGLKGAPEAYWQMGPEEAEKDRQADRDRIYAPEAMPFAHEVRKLILLDRTERLMREIGIPEEFATKAGDCFLEEIKGREPEDGGTGAADLIHRLTRACENRQWGSWKDIPEKIWMDTMKCFPRFIAEYRRSYGREGFDRAGWTVRQAEARLFRIGELEYETAEEGGQKFLSLHIPSDAVLEPERLQASVDEARRFFGAYFPEWADAPMGCESWLLSPALKELLPAESRILRFQAAFDLSETDPEDDAALEWVFHIAEGQKKDVRFDELKEETSLQRRMKALLLSGGKPGSARGILARRF